MGPPREKRPPAPGPAGAATEPRGEEVGGCCGAGRGAPPGRGRMEGAARTNRGGPAPLCPRATPCPGRRVPAPPGTPAPGGEGPGSRSPPHPAPDPERAPRPLLLHRPPRPPPPARAEAQRSGGRSGWRSPAPRVLKAPLFAEAGQRRRLLRWNRNRKGVCCGAGAGPRPQAPALGGQRAPRRGAGGGTCLALQPGAGAGQTRRPREQQEEAGQGVGVSLGREMGRPSACSIDKYLLCVAGRRCAGWALAEPRGGTRGGGCPEPGRSRGGVGGTGQQGSTGEGLRLGLRGEKGGRAGTGWRGVRGLAWGPRGQWGPSVAPPGGRGGRSVHCGEPSPAPRHLSAQAAAPRLSGAP